MALSLTLSYNAAIMPAALAPHASQSRGRYDQAPVPLTCSTAGLGRSRWPPLRSHPERDAGSCGNYVRWRRHWATQGRRRRGRWD
jgi:hypothetical protein